MCTGAYAGVRRDRGSRAGVKHGRCMSVGFDGLRSFACCILCDKARTEFRPNKCSHTNANLISEFCRIFHGTCKCVGKRSGAA